MNLFSRALKLDTSILEKESSEHKRLVGTEKAIARRYKNPIGWWNVKNQISDGGFCEDIGEYYGHVVEIAFHLSDRATYWLEFTKLDKDAPKVYPVYTAKQKTVNIKFNDEAYPPLDKDEKNKFYKKCLKCRDVKIESRRLFSVTLRLSKFENH